MERVSHSELGSESFFIQKKRYIFILPSLFILLISSCSHKTADKEAPAINEIKTGEKFDIILPENHDEGFLWKLNNNHSKSILDNMGAVWHGNDKGVYFRFKAENTGTDTLRFTLYKTQAVTKDHDSIKTAIYIVKVTA